MQRYLKKVDKDEIRISVGVMAHNEGKNIRQFLESLLRQKLSRVYLSEIIVISSGSTDDTERIVKEMIKKRKKIKLFLQKKREGKANAVNLFISKAKEKVLVLSSADILLRDENTVERLVSPLFDPDVGIVGSHPLPLNNPKSFMGFANHLLWELHHQISLKKPKMGEVIAFRNVFQKIPVLSSVDEANIEPLIRGQGYKAVYSPDAIVRNKGPETVREFIERRRHICYGHLATKYEYSYEVSTLNVFNIFFLVLRNIRLSWRFFLFTPFVVILEAYSRLLGFLDYRFKLKSHTVWTITPSTKKLLPE